MQKYNLPGVFQNKILEFIAEYQKDIISADEPNRRRRSYIWQLRL